MWQAFWTQEEKREERDTRSRVTGEDWYFNNTGHKQKPGTQAWTVSLGHRNLGSTWMGSATAPCIAVKATLPQVVNASHRACWALPGHHIRQRHGMVRIGGSHRPTALVFVLVAYTWQPDEPHTIITRMTPWRVLATPNAWMQIPLAILSGEALS